MENHYTEYQTRRFAISKLLDDDHIGQYVHYCAENLSFTFDIGADVPCQYIYVAENGQSFVYLPSSFAAGKYRWGKLYWRNAKEIIPDYDSSFDKDSPYYNEKIVNQQRAFYGLDLLDFKPIDIFANRERCMNEALEGIPI